MIDNRTVQTALSKAGFYTQSIDPYWGPGMKAATIAALASLGVNARAWTEDRVKVAATQWLLKTAGFNPGVVDGYFGQDTKIALERWQNAVRDTVPSNDEIAHQPTTWPRQKDMQAFYGAPGTNHTSLTLPYPMRIAWDKKSTVNRITINKRCAESAGRAFQKALNHYGLPELQRLGLDLFGGCYANRTMRGGTSLSTHAFACAIDMNPEANQLRWGRDRAAMAKQECAAFLDAFESEGWVSLGRERNYDWMHVQAARF